MMLNKTRAPEAGQASGALDIQKSITKSSLSIGKDCTSLPLFATSATSDMLAATIMLANNGYAVHWLRPRSKAPLAAGWSMAPVADVLTLSQMYRPGYNVGVRCGHWSQPMPGKSLVVLDVDIHHEDACVAAMSALATLCGDVSHVPTVLSGSGMGGRHLWFACPLDRLPAKAAMTLARADERMPDSRQWVWQIELLSTGKNLVAPPSVHPSGQPYRWLTPLDDTLPLLPESVHAAIAATHAPMTTPSRTMSRRAYSVPRVQHVHGYRPGDDFNRRADWSSILEPHGWVPVREESEVIYWRRPGKDDGVSATSNYAGCGMLFVFSTNAAPFEANRSYSPFAAYGLLTHRGDFGKAARVLHERGYGIQYRQGFRTIRAWPLALRTIDARRVSPWR